MFSPWRRFSHRPLTTQMKHPHPLPASPLHFMIRTWTRLTALFSVLGKIISQELFRLSVVVKLNQPAFETGEENIDFKAQWSFFFIFSERGENCNLPTVLHLEYPGEYATLPSLVNTTPQSVCERLVQNIGRNVWGYVRDEWVWSPAGAAYSLTQSVSESEQSPPPALFPLLLAHLLIPLRVAYIGQYDLLSCTMYTRMYAQHQVSSDWESCELWLVRYIWLESK